MAKLVIDPQLLAEIRAEIAAAVKAKAESDQEPGAAGASTAGVAAADEMPAKVKAFWHREERLLEPWELETAEERQERLQAESRGCWTG